MKIHFTAILYWPTEGRKMIRFAVFTDLHYDHIPDGDRRIKEFLETVMQKNPDFILSLGDLCYPAAENRKVINALEQSGILVYHTIGNHDTDRYSLKEVMDFLKIESSFYSFLIDNVKFIILNTCYIRDRQKCVPFLKRNYDKTEQAYPWLPQMEADWLLQELESEDCFYVVFSHHSLANDFRNRGIVNREAVRALLEKRRVLFCMNGHYQTVTPEDAEIGRMWNGVSIEPKVSPHILKLTRNNGGENI